nr:hypothetical protein [Tanacetum cinerariifolium]
MAQMRAAVPSTYHLLLPSGTPPLLPIPLPVPSTSRRAEIPEADTPPRKRLLLTTPIPGYEVGESSAAVAARQPGSTTARSFLDSVMIVSTMQFVKFYGLPPASRRYRPFVLKMTPKRTTRSTQVPPVTPASTATITTVTEAQLQTLINQGVAAAMAEAEASRVRNGYSTACQVKYAACTLQGVVLTWWNSHVKTVTLEVDQALPWKTLKKMMIDKVEKYIGGLPDTIHDSVKASKPKTMQEAIEFPTELINKRIRDAVENKKKNDDNNNQAQLQPLKKQGVAIAYTAGPGERNEYAGTLPLCNKCKFYHNGQCTIKYVNCKRVGHLTRDCRSPAATNNHRNPTCYQYGNQGHYRSDCPELKN